VTGETWLDLGLIPRIAVTTRRTDGRDAPEELHGGPEVSSSAARVLLALARRAPIGALASIEPPVGHPLRPADSLRGEVLPVGNDRVVESESNSYLVATDERMIPRDLF
jgi:hypothetical protein